LARRLDQVIVIDVEATCWEGSPPAGQTSEIIEIGVCPIDVVTGKCLPKRSILVRPVRSTVSAFCTQLTTLTQAQVSEGLSFAEACSILRREYDTKHRTWASYGDYDRRQFERQCREMGVENPFGTTHINVKNLFALVHQLPHEVGLDSALQQLNLPLEGTHHRGDDDAGNIAKILCLLLSRVRIQS
jgi:inhibitor of KinA sporulation pathway (predicted exonuclease)